MLTTIDVSNQLNTQTAITDFFTGGIFAERGILLDVNKPILVITSTPVGGIQAQASDAILEESSLFTFNLIGGTTSTRKNLTSILKTIEDYILTVGCDGQFDYDGFIVDKVLKDGPYRSDVSDKNRNVLLQDYNFIYSYK